MVLHIQEAHLLFLLHAKRFAPRDIDEPEVPDIGVPSIGVDGVGVDGKPPKDDAMTARAPRSYFWHVAVYKAGVSLLYLPAISLYCRSLLKYREYGQSRRVLPWTLDKLRQSVSVNIQCRREMVRVDSLNQELSAQFSGQDTEFLGKTNQKGQTGQHGNYWLKRTLCQQYRRILISHTPNRLFRSIG